MRFHLVGTTDVDDETNPPDKFSLSQNYPNPFNPSKNIEFKIPESRFVTLKIYDILGKEAVKLVNEAKQAGGYSINFDASNLPGGIYFYSLTAGILKESKKMILLK